MYVRITNNEKMSFHLFGPRRQSSVRSDTVETSLLPHNRTVHSAYSLAFENLDLLLYHLMIRFKRNDGRRGLLKYNKCSRIVKRFARLRRLSSLDRDKRNSEFFIRRII